MAYLNPKELIKIGFASVGKEVKVSDKAVIYGASRITIDDFSRIDDFCILSAGEGGIKIGKYVHIAPYCSLIGKGEIVMENFSGLSSKVAIYSSSDDYGGNFLTNPCVPAKFTNVISGQVIIKKHVIIGVGAAVLPNVTIGIGSAVGAFSLVSKNIPDNVIAIGVPAKPIRDRKKGIFLLEQELLKNG